MRTILKISIRADLRSLLRSYSLILILDVLVLSNVVRLLRSGIRSVLAILVDLSRGELLESNRSLNRLSHIIVHRDGDRLLAFGLLRSEGLFTLAQDSLAISLGNELSLQGVFLLRNQTLIGDLINNLGTSNNLMRTILKISIRADLRLKLLLLLAGSRSRFRIRNYISSFAWSRLISFIRSSSLRIRRLGIRGRLGRRSLSFRILRGSLFGRILLSIWILWRSSRLFRAATIIWIIRQTGLVWRQQTLGTTFIIRTGRPWDYDRDVVLIRIGFNLGDLRKARATGNPVTRVFCSFKL